MSKLKYGQDELTLDINTPILAQTRLPRYINGLGLPETFNVVNRYTGEVIDEDTFPEENATYVIEVREQKKNEASKKPAPKKPAPKKPAPKK